MVNGESVTGSYIYQSAMLMKDVQPWSVVRGRLGEYKLVGWRNKQEEDSMFQKPKSLVDVLDEMAILGVHTYAIVNEFTPEETKLLGDSAAAPSAEKTTNP